MTQTPLLQVDNLWVGYGQAAALFGVSLQVNPATIVAVVGANGAGKSTLARAVTGLVPSKSGTISLAGQSITGKRPHTIRRAGVSYLPEGRGILPGLSVLDNLRMAVRWATKQERRDGIDKSYAMFPILAQRSGQRAGSLSGGEQQMLSIARGLAIQPKLLIADELSLGLAPLLVEEAVEALVRAREGGVAVILIEQYVDMALEVADECMILSRGETKWFGEASSAKEAVVEAYMGAGER